MIFSGDTCYEEGRIRVAYYRGRLCGFSCGRLRKRDGVFVLYFVGVSERWRGNGIGSAILDSLWEYSDVVELKVMKDNPAVRLYLRRNFVKIGEAYGGTAWILRANKKPRHKDGVSRKSDLSMKKRT